MTYGPLTGGEPFGGEFEGVNTDGGTFQATPEEGDCVRRPITRLGVVLRWTMSG